MGGGKRKRKIKEIRAFYSPELTISAHSISLCQRVQFVQFKLVSGENQRFDVIRTPLAGEPLCLESPRAVWPRAWWAGRDLGEV